MILPSAPSSPRHSPLEPPSLTQLVPAASIFYRVVMPLLALLSLFAFVHAVTRGAPGLEDIYAKLLAVARGLSDMNAGSVAFFASVAAACFASRVGLAMRELGWRNGDLPLSKMPWSRIEVVSPVIERNARMALRGACAVLAAATLVLVPLIFLGVATSGTPNYAEAVLDSVIPALAPADILAGLTALCCRELLSLGERRAGDGQLGRPAQAACLSVRILASHAAGRL